MSLTASAAIAQTVTPGFQKWQLSFTNPKYKLQYHGDVEEENGTYKMVFKSVKASRGEGTVSIQTAGQEVSVSQTKRPLYGSTPIVSEPSASNEIRFRVPIETTRYIPDGLLSLTSDPHRYFPNETEKSFYLEKKPTINDLNAFISEPDRKLGKFEDGRRISDGTESASAVANFFLQLVPASGGPQRDAFRFLMPILNASNPVSAQQIPLTGSPPRSRGTFTFDADFTSIEWIDVVLSSGLKVQEQVTKPRRQRITADIYERSVAGMELVLHSKEEDGDRILWSWRLEASPQPGQTVVLSKGSPDTGNPLVWGPQPHITAVIVLNAQEAGPAQLDKISKVAEETEITPLFPWPGKAGEKIQDAASPVAFEREILVVGEHLKDWKGQRPRSGHRSVKYSQFKDFQIEALQDHLRNYDQNALSDDQQEAYQIALRTAPTGEELEALHVTAAIEGPIDAQPVGLEIDDARAAWPLLFGNHNVKIDILRIGVPAPDQFDQTVRLGDRVTRPGVSRNLRQTSEERANPVFFRDEIAFEATLRSADDFEEDIIEVVLGGSRTTADQTAEVITLKRVANDPKRFRSKTYIVTELETGPNASEINNTKAVSVRSDTYSDVPDDKALPWPRDTVMRPRARSLMTARPLPDAPVVLAETVTGNFIEALKRSHSDKCQTHPLPAVEWETLTVLQEADAAKQKSLPLHTSSIGLGKSVETYLGQHAALLMVRDQYVQIAGKALAELQKIDATNVSSPSFLGLLGDLWAGAPVVAASLPLGSATVADFVAERRRKGQSLLPQPGQANAFDTGREKIAAAVDRGQQDLAKSLAVAKAAGDCNIWDLALLTSTGFEPIVQLLMTQVSRLEYDHRDNIQKRRPDLTARRYLNSLDALYGELQAERNLVSMRWSFIKANASVIAFWAGLHAVAYEAGGAAFTAAAIETWDAATTCIDNICGYREDRKRLGIARGAATIFGPSYLKDIEDRTGNTAWRVAESIIQIAGAGFAFDDALKAYQGTKILGDAQTILNNSDSFASNYGNLARASETKGFRGIARRFWKEANGKTNVLTQELDPKTTAALSEFLGTPPKHLSNSLRRIQKEMREAFEKEVFGTPGYLQALSQKAYSYGELNDLTKFPDGLDAVGIANEIGKHYWAPDRQPNPWQGPISDTLGTQPNPQAITGSGGDLAELPTIPLPDLPAGPDVIFQVPEIEVPDLTIDLIPEIIIQPESLPPGALVNPGVDGNEKAN